MFDYTTLTDADVIEFAQSLDRKIIRWLGSYHPDNRTRKIFFRLTNVEIGQGTVVNRNLVISDNYEPLVRIGCRVSISPNVTIIAASDPNNSLLRDNKYVKDNLIRSDKVTIEDDAWIGSNVVILPGVTVGRKTIVGAGAVITKDTPISSIVAGIPAKVIRKLET
jgi:acetyltransferase-like isoleucine patch superfamily enzyme